MGGPRLTRAAVLGGAAVLGCSPAAAPPPTAAVEPAHAVEPARPARRPIQPTPKRPVASELRLPDAGKPRVVDRSDGPAADPATEAKKKPSRCPEGMAFVRRAKGPYCIDRYEATLVRVGPDGRETEWAGNRSIDGREREFRAVSVAGRKPQGYISGEQAEAVCKNAGKRLCEIDEWVVACRGPDLSTYPYGEQRLPNRCNDRFKKLDRHPIPRLFKKHAPAGTDPKLMWHPKWMDDSRIHEMTHTVVPTGSKLACSNAYGVYDMVGNLHEWVSDPDGTFFGGFFMDTFQNGHGCGYRTIAHPYDYHDYSTGFRCCTEAAPADASP